MANNKLESMPMRRLVMNMSLPLMVSLLVQSLYNIVDGIFVAKLSEDALTATSLVFPIQMLMIAVGVGTAVGVNSLLSRSIGAKDATLTQMTAATGVVLSCFSTVLFMAFGLVGTQSFVAAFTENAQIAKWSEDYLLICTLFCLGSFVATMYQRFLQAVGDTKSSMISLIAGAVTNIILDPIMIFGLLGFPRLEVLGAAIATVIGQWVSALAAIWLNKTKNSAVPVRFRGYRFDVRTAGKIYQVGLPTIVTQALGSVMMAGMNKILMPLSVAAVAFFGAYYKLQNFLFMPMNGLGQAAIPIVGFNYGAKNDSRVKEAVRTILPIAVGIAVAASALFLVLPKQLLGMFSPTEEMLSIGVPALRIIAGTFPLATVTMILGYAMSGLGNGVVNMLGTALRQLIVLLPLAWLLADQFGVGSVWYAFWAGELLAMGYAIVAAKRGMKKAGVTSAQIRLPPPAGRPCTPSG